MAFLKRCLILTLLFVTTIFYIASFGTNRLNIIDQEYIVSDNYFLEKQFSKYVENWRELTKNQTSSLSKLGRILYLNEKPPEVKKRESPYKILVWKYGPAIEKRHLYHFTNTKHNPFEDCPVNNCVLTYKDEDLNTSDIVLIHLHRTNSLGELPPWKNRNHTQIWAFLTDESPYHTFLKSKLKLHDFNGIFNWSMTYKMNSDIPVPYGRVVLKESAESRPILKEFNDWRRSRRSDVLVAILGSNCGSKNHRWEYVKQLKKYINVDAYGACGTLKCPGHFGSDCQAIDNYLFYLAFENSNCDDYITEKLWWNAYHKNAIPIIMGPEKSNLAKLLPYQSYLTVEDFAGPRDLANYLLYLNNTPSELLNYFAWKSKYAILNEHGYFKSSSYHYCRVCEALNYNSKEHKVYDDLETFWSTKDCYPAWDA